MNTLKQTVLWLGLALSLLAVVLSTSACELGGDITFENHLSNTLTINYSQVESDGSLGGWVQLGIISPNTTKTFPIVFIDRSRVNRIQAVDTSGKIVFSHDYKMADLDKIGWKIVIPAQ